MHVQTTVRFVLTLVGSLAAFYLGAVLFHATGYLNDHEMQRLSWMYNQMLSPVTSVSWTTQKTILAIAIALALQAFLLCCLFRRWSYRPVKRIDRLAVQAPVEAMIEVSGARPPSHVLRMYTGSSVHHD